jgi:hypothetical protein
MQKVEATYCGLIQTIKIIVDDHAFYNAVERNLKPCSSLGLTMYTIISGLLKNANFSRLSLLPRVCYSILRLR